MISSIYLQDVIKTSKTVALGHRNWEVLQLARSMIPEQIVKAAEEYRKQPPSENAEFEFIMEFMSWFKNNFFKWVDKPECTSAHCKKGNPSTRTNVGRYCVKGEPGRPLTAYNVEIYECNLCHSMIHFPRHSDPKILLYTRKGRCGEWANCFTLLCRALGFESRLIMDSADHVWTEVFFESSQRWVHCDACETSCDAPLMYKLGWNKQLTHVIAYSPEEVQDVTWRYTDDFEETLRLRRTVDERALVHTILSTTETRQMMLPRYQRDVLMKRRINELFEMMLPAKPSGQYGGRTSGALLWRMGRGEVSFSNPEQFGNVWILNEEEITSKSFRLTYSCREDKYVRHSTSSISAGWKSGVWCAELMMRKVEYDWNMCYLCRESQDRAFISWKFTIPENKDGLRIEHVTVSIPSTTYHDGVISIIICGDDVSLQLPNNSQGVNGTEKFRGSTGILVKAELRGGQGKEAWQHTQLCRTKRSPPTPDQKEDGQFQVVITLAPI